MTPRLSSLDFVERVMQHGVPSRGLATRAVFATLRVLGQRLTDDEAKLVADALQNELGRVVDQSEYDGDFDEPEFYARVARIAKTPLGAAHEHADVVLRVMGDVLDDAALARVRRALPGRMGDRLVGESFGAPPAYGRPKRAPRSTLAQGKPGPHEPLCEAHPVGHRHSVANEANPHGDTKLSSASGPLVGSPIATAK